MIYLEGVSKSYSRGSVKAVDDLTLDVREGEIFGFLGPNGAGKTTTIKMMVGLLVPDSGRVLVHGVDVWRDPIGAKMNIGFVPDNPNVYERLTGLEYLNFLGDVYQVPAEKRKQRLEELVEMFEMTGALHDLISSYSHGMKQKIVLIGALIHEPRVLVLDEPMVGLDPKSSHTLKEIMKGHTARGNTVFFSTHVLEVAERLCNRIGIIHKGRLIACGPLEELRSRRDEAESLENLFLELTEN